MIVYEREHDFVMTRQDDHARLAGMWIPYWKRFYGDRREEMHLSVTEHDRGWIGLDETPLWNDAEDKPYTFIDTPVLLRLAFYTKGLDEVQSKSPYAALINSLHFTSFFPPSVLEEGLKSGEFPPQTKEWVDAEKRRQKEIREKLGLTDETSEYKVKQHLALFKCCDNLSLFICMHDPGTRRKLKLFAGAGFTFMAQWQDSYRLQLDPYVLDRELECEIGLKVVPKQLVRQEGIARAYAKTETARRVFRLVGKS
ncbi:hypothetical protein ERICIV_03482 [Paenibacillus larvae subsp. larvae]|uniref:DUF3891 domain-containing protein n=1 Tax=Paenibacillus larvae subsp. larvae TaxID=147375 RepID=A0A2L1U4N4_9BACL|nr:DUF3891 family protein [Paenibacillus larvae]AQZ46181.1 hypothetical protein B5S25_05650 [Paenibacillus larvae subsp. pulvifaciens]AVF27848.1 hypothetical protein ERICIII_03739 [Paenibacillus larvae subsp. larvae]AVF32351.1 hypothetical protein ERICIV_03482 [Paenibacillus larvae subsp. larvae]MCY7519532.1 DUF3891 family protein [Paenibacillus larvae]MCY9501088.1 DUF3891 family protein [Paenibacillus larvae]